MVAEKRPALTDDEHVHIVEPDHEIRFFGVLRQVGDCQAFEGISVEPVLGESVAGVAGDSAANEDQDAFVLVVVRDEVDAVVALRPAFLEDLKALALEVRFDAGHCLAGDRCFHC